ncbi:MAG: hypothetical protein ACRD0P_38975, partial [Stackebrandtia sp.]
MSSTVENMARLRSRAASLGMYFGLAEPDPPGDWRPVTALTHTSTCAERTGTGTNACGDDPLAILLDRVRESVGGEPRVAASLLYQGFASRLWSPQIAWLLLGQRVAPPGADRLYWRHPKDQLMELAAPVEAGHSGDPGQLWTELI